MAVFRKVLQKLEAEVPAAEQPEPCEPVQEPASSQGEHPRCSLKWWMALCMSLLQTFRPLSRTGGMAGQQQAQLGQEGHSDMKPWLVLREWDDSLPNDAQQDQVVSTFPRVHRGRWYGTLRKYLAQVSIRSLRIWLLHKPSGRHARLSKALKFDSSQKVQCEARFG